jgi:hypothetical protein
VIQLDVKYLITTDNWFTAPDGMQYRNVFGTARGIYSADDTLGLTTNRNSTNWYVSIGNMIIAGCQIHYVIQTDKVNEGDIQEDEQINGEIKKLTYRSKIYNADKEYN